MSVTVNFYTTSSSQSTWRCQKRLTLGVGNNSLSDSPDHYPKVEDQGDLVLEDDVQVLAAIVQKNANHILQRPKNQCFRTWIAKSISNFFMRTSNQLPTTTLRLTWLNLPPSEISNRLPTKHLAACLPLQAPVVHHLSDHLIAEGVDRELDIHVDLLQVACPPPSTPNSVFSSSIATWLGS